MTHRDELLAMRARLHALKHEIDDVREENDLLRDAHTQRALEAETLRRELSAARAAPPEEVPFDADAWSEEILELTPDDPPPDPRLRRIDRALPAAALAAGLVFIGGMTFAGLGALHLARARAVAAQPATYVTALSRPGTVATVEHIEGLDRGDACLVRREPVAAGPFDCRVVVECGGRVLYGADPNSGFVRCGGREWVQDPDVTAIDGDPAMTMDVALDVVTVEDQVGPDRWRVRVRI